MKKKKNTPHLGRQRRGFFLLFGLPTILIYFYISILPMISSLIDSFTDWAGYRSPKNFIGFSNYIELFQDPVFYKAIVNDLIISGVKVVAITGFALFFAIALTRIGLHRTEVKIYRYLLYLPTILPIVVITIVWRFIFNADGLLNSILAAWKNLHYSDFPAWLDQYPVAIISFVACWCGIGGSMIILIAAINNVSRDLYEAAYMDGAGQWKQLLYVTIPGIRNQIAYVVVTVISGSLAGNMNLVLPMTNGEPDNASTVMGLYVYKHGLDSIVRSRVGYANAAAVILMIVSFVICYGFQRLMDKGAD